MQRKSDQLFATAQNLIPGGVNSPVRAFRGVGGTPRFIRSARGATITDVDGQHLHRLRRFVGADDPRSRRRRSRRCGAGSRSRRHELRSTDRARGASSREEDRRRGPFDRDGAHGEQRHRSDDVGHSPRARLHWPDEDREVRRLLSRARR